MDYVEKNHHHLLFPIVYAILRVMNGSFYLYTYTMSLIASTMSLIKKSEHIKPMPSSRGVARV